LYNILIKTTHRFFNSLFAIGKPKKGETLFVSAASGAVGQLVGQLGKEFGLRVVGAAGSDDKVDYLKTIGFDDAFNYKTENISEALGRTCPDGIDLYFENVGGETLEAVITHMNVFGRIIACGMISQYNTQEPYGVKNLVNIVGKRIRFEGFIVSDHPELEPEFLTKVIALLQEGKFKYRESISEGIETTPEALLDVLKGNNFGKQVVKVDRSL
jgi:NADPH-dependent curcumin reductase CurA